MSQKQKAGAALAMRSRLMLLLVMGLAAGCGGRPDVPVVSPCTPPDPALEEAAFVIATAPRAGEAVTSGFAVRGCSRTFESNVQWRLANRKGRVLARGFTSGGGGGGGKNLCICRGFPGVRAPAGVPGGERTAGLGDRGISAGPHRAAPGAGARAALARGYLFRPVQAPSGGSCPPGRIRYPEVGSAALSRRVPGVKHCFWRPGPRPCRRPGP